MILKKILSLDLHSTAKDVTTEILVVILDSFNNIERNKLVSLNSFLDPRFKLYVFSNEDTTKKYVTQLVAAKIAQSNKELFIPVHDNGQITKATEQHNEYSVFNLFDSVISNVSK